VGGGGGEIDTEAMYNLRLVLKVNVIKIMS